MKKKIAIIWRGETNAKREISWQELDQIIANFCAKLTACGVKSKQVIAYSGQHKLISLCCYLAVLRLDARILMLNPNFTDHQKQRILADNGIEFFVTDQQFLDQLGSHNNKNKKAEKINAFNLTQPATLTLTSGSSGKPKAVVHSIANHLASAEGVCELMSFDSEKSWLLSLPLFHVSGQGIVWRWWREKAMLYIDENKATFFETLFKVTHASLVPTQLQRYLAWLSENNKTGQNQQVLLGGANIPSELVEQAKAKNVTTFTGYGMTEMASTVTAVKFGKNSVGKPLKGREVTIQNDEIWVRGEPLGLGYWQKNNLQKSDIILPLVNAQGWFQTKDRGYWNEENELVIAGRLDNMFISGGENIQPEEIEKVLFQSQLVKNVFIVPKSDQEFGERPVALVEFIDEFNSQAVRSLQDFAKKQLEKFRQPIDYLPFESEKWHNGGIKVSRQKLKEYINRI